MMQQIQEQVEHKKFGRYHVISKFKNDGGDGIIISGNMAMDIRIRLSEYSQLNDVDKIIFLDTKLNIHQREFSKSYYHVKDSTIELANSGCGVYEAYLTIYNNDINKRKATRKFLEEILK